MNMARHFKTKEVSHQIGVSERTIRKWVNQYDIPHQKNNKGHYLFNEKSIQHLKNIKDHEKKETQYSIRNKETNLTNSITIQDANQQLDQMLTRLDLVEMKLSEKADEIVSVQVLNHRNEIDEIFKRMDEMDQKITKLMENHSLEMTPKVHEQNETEPVHQSKKSWFMSLFSF